MKEETSDLEVKIEENFEENLEQKIEENKTPNPLLLSSDSEDKFVIKIPDTAKMEDFQELKEFLLTLPNGKIKIFIEFKEKQKDTKITLDKLEELEKWTRERWE
jgi:hypothetical protein